MLCLLVPLCKIRTGVHFSSFQSQPFSSTDCPNIEDILPGQFDPSTFLYSHTPVSPGSGAGQAVLSTGEHCTVHCPLHPTLHCAVGCGAVRCGAECAGERCEVPGRVTGSDGAVSAPPPATSYHRQGWARLSSWMIGQNLPKLVCLFFFFLF